MTRTRLRSPMVALGLLVAPAACVGTIDEFSGTAPPEGGTPEPGTVRKPPGTPSTAPGPAAQPGPGGEATFVSFRRLSRDELVASFEALTGSAPSREDLPEDQRAGHSPLTTAGLTFLGTELEKLKLVVDGFAARVAPTLLADSGCKAQGQAQRDCLGAWMLKLGERAFRRPLTETESTQMRRFFESAGESQQADTTIVQAALSGLLFAPSFLYRLELGAPLAGKPLVRELGQHEIATRLSYLATSAPPDAELLAAAAAGRLKDPAERARQFERLAGTERGRKAMALFVLEWLGANESKIRDKSPKYLNGLNDTFEPGIRGSAEAAIRKVVSEADPTLANLLTTDAYLGDAAVKTITTPTGSAASTAGDVAQTGRAGLLMHPFVLSAHTKEDGPSPFQIGVFIKEALLCEHVPTPPADAVAMANNDVPDGLSMREDLEFRSSAPICSACHSLFAPLGYTFLPFDPVGRWTKQDPSGKPWNLTGKVPTQSGTPLEFDSPGALSRQMSLHPQVQHCFAESAVRWTFGRDMANDQPAFIEEVAGVANRTKGSVPAVFKAIVVSPGFTQSHGKKS